MPLANTTTALVFTDGSCHTQKRIGAWVAILFFKGNKIILQGTEHDTTHNRMELLAVIKAIEHLRLNEPGVTAITVYSDSQYVTELPGRAKKLAEKNFITKAGKGLQNTELVQQLLQLLQELPVTLVKIKAHLKKTEAINYNIEADLLVRNLLREAVENFI